MGVVLAVAAGVGLGVGCLLWIVRAPSTWAALANSSAGWALAAFAFGMIVRAGLGLGLRTTSVLGVVMLAVAVEASYLALAHERSEVSGAVAYADRTLLWLVAAVVAGSVFALAGAWAVDPDRRRIALGCALGAAVALGEAWHVHDEPIWRFLSPGGYLRPSTAGLVVAGLVVLALALRRPLAFVGAVLLLVPLAALTVVGFVVTGIPY